MYPYPPARPGFSPGRLIWIVIRALARPPIHMHWPGPKKNPAEPVGIDKYRLRIHDHILEASPVPSFGLLYSLHIESMGEVLATQISRPRASANHMLSRTEPYQSKCGHGLGHTQTLELICTGFHTVDMLNAVFGWSMQQLRSGELLLAATTAHRGHRGTDGSGFRACPLRKQHSSSSEATGSG
jgi:hypothetical protein